MKTFLASLIVLLFVTVPAYAEPITLTGEEAEKVVAEGVVLTSMWQDDFPYKIEDPMRPLLSMPTHGFYLVVKYGGHIYVCSDDLMNHTHSLWCEDKNH